MGKKGKGKENLDRTMAQGGSGGPSLFKFSRKCLIRILKFPLFTLNLPKSQNLPFVSLFPLILLNFLKIFQIFTFVQPVWRNALTRTKKTRWSSLRSRTESTK